MSLATALSLIPPCSSRPSTSLRIRPSIRHWVREPPPPASSYARRSLLPIDIMVPLLVSLVIVAAEDRSGYSVTLTGSPDDAIARTSHLSFRSAVPDQTLVRPRHIQCARQP